MQRALQQTLHRSVLNANFKHSARQTVQALIPYRRNFFGGKFDQNQQATLDTFVPHARGRALQELLGDKEDEEEDKTPVATSLQWDPPLKVLIYPDPRLRAENARVGVFDESLRRLAEEMFEVMYDDETGVGLAAPQVGVNVRMMVWNEAGKKGEGEEVVLVNPKIISSSKDRSVFEEGCLSFPNIYGDVVRPSKVKVKAQDLNGKTFTVNISGFAARIFQHEFDHLQGTLLCDRVEPSAMLQERKNFVALEEEFIKANPGVKVRRLPAK